MNETERLRAYIVVLRRKLDGATRAVRMERLRADALEPGWAAKWDRRLGRERALEVERDAAIRERDEAVDAAHVLSTQKNDLTLALDEVRDVLAPLLEHPARDDGELETCVFCWARAEVEHELTHAPGCPVLRRDALQGRSDA